MHPYIFFDEHHVIPANLIVALESTTAPDGTTPITTVHHIVGRSAYSFEVLGRTARELGNEIAAAYGQSGDGVDVQAGDGWAGAFSGWGPIIAAVVKFVLDNPDLRARAEEKLNITITSH